MAVKGKPGEKAKKPGEKNKTLPKERIITAGGVNAKVSDVGNIAAGGRRHRYAVHFPIDTETADKLLSRQQQQKYTDTYKLVSEYSLAGLEFGNWTTHEERANFLISTRESLKDLHKILGFKNLGLDHRVSIAFGARGLGGKAMAHFEASSFAINLTRTKGYGSFAHEYGHALDYFFGSFVDQQPYSAWLSGGQSEAQNLSQTGQMRKVCDQIINRFYRDEKGNETTTITRMRPKVKGEYWYRRNEIFARLFEQYIHFELSRLNLKNQYLTDRKYAESVAYATEKDFKAIAPLYKKLLALMRKHINGK
ncbi:hypothetical protein QNI19_16400 [Cytophagaceae bacterium DM2B3-1]|uniref:Large polyvalent protein-associated domain-containing protein n=1 Tax=Xanthocytophaga flava TaxID=3048013 RepID=A0ABT7CNG0_9BACT|nr:LPD1 domain-containing protein [Xanthocytophaga flavus]MDJ1494527.1 hypothetical protein [Xanthocytophaga flavus]